MKHCDSDLHVRGLSEFVDDVIPPANLLHAAVFCSPVAHGTITSLNVMGAERAPGVVSVLRHADIPGNAYIGAVVQDQPLFAHEEVMYQGQAIALVVAESARLAREAVEQIEISIEPLDIITCPRQALQQGQIFEPTRVTSKGNVDAAWSDCDVVVSGEVDMGGQEHLYLETQRARAFPKEDGQFFVQASTQGPTAMQKTIASMLGVPIHKIEVDVKRLGGGFGGKEDQATPWGCMVVLAAHHLARPVQLVLNRQDDMRMTGKRHPYIQSYKIGVNSKGKILAYQIAHYQNSGAFLDLSSSILDRTLMHSTNAYAISNVLIEATLCRTNLPPNTAFRGFGAPQGMLPLEAAIYQAASRMKVAPDWIQERNLVSNGYQFPYGQKMKDANISDTWEMHKQTFSITEVKDRVEAYNATHRGKKKGLALMPVCFGISFTKSFLNQGSSLVHIYTDGSVSVSTGGVEMGQGVSSNIIVIAARTLGISHQRIRYNSTNTSRIANASPSAASSTTDLNGNATIIACEKILAGMKLVAGTHLDVDPDSITIKDGKVYIQNKQTNLTWDELVWETYKSRHTLMAHGYYASPGLHFDPEKRKGTPFHYYSQGVSLIEVTVDCLLGTYTIDAVKISHDLGRAINPDIDLGQVEGGVAQGIGWVTIEELIYDQQGVLESNSLSTYKIPDATFLPDQFDIQFIDQQSDERGALGRKAVGEPPFMYGIAAFFAIQQGIDAFRRQQGATQTSGPQEIVVPMTPERVLMALYPDIDNAATAS